MTSYILLEITCSTNICRFKLDLQYVPYASSYKKFINRVQSIIFLIFDSDRSISHGLKYTVLVVHPASAKIKLLFISHENSDNSPLRRHNPVDCTFLF